MSQSFAHDGETDPNGGPSSGGSLDEQLADEIADHLAAAAGDLVRRGEPRDQAAQRALARFGDVARVKRQCWWIHKGDEVMIRTAAIGALVLLTIGVAVVGFGGWQLQRNLTSRTEELSEQLASLSATQKAMLDQQRPPEISGLAYLGDPSRPAKDVEIQVYKFSEEPAISGQGKPTGVVVRRLRTDESGRFESGVLQSGEYCLLGPLMGPDGQLSEQERLFTQLQSRPLYLVAGVGKSIVDLNLAASTQVRLEASGIPASVTIAGEEVPVLVGMTTYPDGVRFYEQGPLSPSAEPPRDGWPFPLPLPHYNIAGASVKPTDLPKVWFLPSRAYTYTVQLSLSAQSSGGGYQQPILTKGNSDEIKLSPGDLGIIAVSMAGDSLQVLADAASKDYQSNLKGGGGVVFGPGAIPAILKTMAIRIELKVDVAIQHKDGGTSNSGGASP